MWQVDGLKMVMNAIPVLDGSSVLFVLFQAVPAGTGRNRVFDVAEIADFPGYGNIMLTWPAGSVVDSEDHGKNQTAVLRWERNAGGSPQTIYGMGLMWSNDAFVASIKGVIYWDFPTPLVMVDEDSFIERVVTLYDDLWTHPVHA